MPSRSALLILAATAAAAVPSRPRGDDSSFRPYLVGARAAGLGGAFTALADDGSGPYYNPGGIAFVTRSQLSIAGSVYGLVSGTFDNALGIGAERHDFSYRNLNIFPTATAGVWKLDDGSRPEHADVLSLGVFVPDAVNVDARDQILSQQNAVTLVQQTQTVWVGLTYARRMGRLGIGASLFGLLGTNISQLDLTAAGPATGNTAPADFAIVTARTDETRYGAVGALGVRWDATDALRLGLSVYTPAVGSGSRRLFVRGAAAGAFGATGAPGISVVNAEDLHATPTDPWRVQAGIAWTAGRWTLAADAVYLAARDVLDDAGRVAQVPGGAVSLARHVVREAVVNGSVGAEYLLSERVPLRAGFFTDRAASPATSTTGDVQNSAHLDRFGGSTSIGYRTEHTATDLGVNVSGGSGQDLVFGQDVDVTTQRVTGTSQLLLYVFLSTSYQF